MMKGICIFLFIIYSSFAAGHESRPVFLKITQNDIGIDMIVNLPNSVEAHNTPFIYIDTLLANRSIEWTIHESGYRQEWTLQPFGTLRGRTVTIRYPLFNPVLTNVVDITLADNEEIVMILPPGKNTLDIPSEANASTIRWQYSVLGIRHIWAGIDHLLFIFCLVIIAGFSKKLLLTITGFTLAHSVTLVLAALGVVRVPIPPIEGSIALSIVFLCYEIAHHHHDKKSLTYRRPILVASSFGFLHGLGFAAVLGVIGLPHKHTTNALLFFNIGVEIGQVLFIFFLGLLVLAVHVIGTRFLPASKTKLATSLALRVVVYVIGITAAYWMFERIL